MKLELEDGKYTIILADDYSEFKALRYGEEWRNLVGDNLIHALVHKVEELETDFQKQQCTQCPHSIGDTYQRDCSFPDCVGGWEVAFHQLNTKYIELLQKSEGIKR